MTPEEVADGVQNGFGCSGKNCLSDVDVRQLLRSRSMAEQLSQVELECFPAGKLDMMCRRGEVSHGRATSAESRRRLTYDYSIGGVSVCIPAFLYAHCITRYTLQKVQSHLEADCVSPSPHASKETQPWNAASAEDVEVAVSFVKNYANVHGLPQPAAPRGHNKPRTNILVQLHNEEVGSF